MKRNSILVLGFGMLAGMALLMPACGDDEPTKTDAAAKKDVGAAGGAIGTGGAVGVGGAVGTGGVMGTGGATGAGGTTTVVPDAGLDVATGGDDGPAPGRDGRPDVARPEGRIPDGGSTGIDGESLEVSQPDTRPIDGAGIDGAQVKPDVAIGQDGVPPAVDTGSLDSVGQ